MKKKLSVLLVTSVILEMAAITETKAAVMTDYYADVYGVTVCFDSAVYNTTIEGYSLTDGEEVIATTPVIKENKVMLVPEEQLEINRIYTLDIADVKKEFKIKTLFFENFDSKEDGVISELTAEENSFGKYLVNPGSGEAFYSNGELALTNALFSVSEFTDEQDTKNVTYMMDIKGYGKKTAKLPANVGLVNIRMGGRSKSADSVNNGYACRLINRKIHLGNVDETGTFKSMVNTDYKDETYGFSLLTDAEILLNGSYNYDNESRQRKTALRMYNNEITGIVDGEEMLSIKDDTYTDGFCNVFADDRTLALVDNVRITYCTEDVIDPEYGEVKALDIDGDFDSLKLKFDRTLVGTKSFEKIKVYENGEPVNADISLNTADSTIINIIPENYKSQNTYRIVVEEGFGTKTMWTYEEFAFEKYIAPQEVKVINAEVNLKGVIIDFDTDIKEVTDFSKVKVFENNEPIGADISFKDKRLTIIPNNYVLDNKYKVVIEQGFGDENIYFFEEYSYEDILTKPELEIEEIIGIKNDIQVKFNNDISDIRDFSKVKVLREGIEQNVKCSANKNTLNISVDNIESDIEYVLFIEKGFESNTALMKKAYLKKFSFATLIFEDFEDDKIAEGISVAGTNFTDKTGNVRRIIWSGSMWITLPEAIEAEQLWVSFDYQLYTASMNNADKQYNSPIPYSLWEYNLATQEAKDGYSIYFNAGAARFRKMVNGTPTELGRNNFTPFVFGDAYCVNRDAQQFVVYDLGDKFPEEIAEKYGVSECQRATPPVYHIDMVKDKAAIELYSDGTCIANFNPDNPVRTAGYIRVCTQITEMMTLDNVKVCRFMLSDSDSVDASAFKLADDGELSQKTEAIGSFILENFSQTEKPVRAVIAAYGDNNLMQSAQILDIKAIGPGEMRKETFTLDKLSNAKQLRLYVWDTLDNMSMYKSITIN